jgi:hypothetical protein
MIMRNYYLSNKTHSFGVSENTFALCWEERHLGEPVNLKISRQVTMYRSRITNVQYSVNLPVDCNFTVGYKLFGPRISSRMQWNLIVTDSKLGNHPTFWNAQFYVY